MKPFVSYWLSKILLLFEFTLIVDVSFELVFSLSVEVKLTS